MIDHQYDSVVHWTGEKKGQLGAVGLAPLEMATPPEFGGHPGLWSPEHLFVAAANACLLSTFLALAERARLRVAGYRAEAHGRLTQTEDGRGLAITEIEISPVVGVYSAEDEERARDLCLKAEKHCLISHSMTSVIHVTPRVEVIRAALAL